MHILHTCVTYIICIHDICIPKYIQTNVCMHYMLACVVCALPPIALKQQLTPAHTRCCTTICERRDQSSSSSQKQKRNKKTIREKRMQAARSSRLWWQLVLLVRARCRCGSCVCECVWVHINYACVRILAHAIQTRVCSHTRIHMILIYVIMHA